MTQETKLKAFRSFDRLKPGTDAKAWVITILRNTRIDILRSRVSSDKGVSVGRLTSEPEAPEQQAFKLDGDAVWRDPESVLPAFEDQQIIDAMRRSAGRDAMGAAARKRERVVDLTRAAASRFWESLAIRETGSETRRSQIAVLRQLAVIECIAVTAALSG